jgi:hypothetical protein
VCSAGVFTLTRNLRGLYVFLLDKFLQAPDPAILTVQIESISPPRSEPGPRCPKENGSSRFSFGGRRRTKQCMGIVLGNDWRVSPNDSAVRGGAALKGSYTQSFIVYQVATFGKRLHMVCATEQALVIFRYFTPGILKRSPLKKQIEPVKPSCASPRRAGKSRNSQPRLLPIVAKSKVHNRTFRDIAGCSSHRATR